MSAFQPTGEVLFDTAAYTRKFCFMVAAMGSLLDQVAVRLPDGTIGMNPAFSGGAVRFERTIPPPHFQALYERVWHAPTQDNVLEITRTTGRPRQATGKRRHSVPLDAQPGWQILQIGSCADGSLENDGVMRHLRDIASVDLSGRLLPGEIGRRRAGMCAGMLADIAHAAEAMHAGEGADPPRPSR